MRGSSYVCRSRPCLAALRITLRRNAAPLQGDPLAAHTRASCVEAVAKPTGCAIAATNPTDPEFVDVSAVDSRMPEFGLRTSPITRSSSVTPNRSQIISNLSISGYAFSDSHFEMACRETPSSIASCSCVMLRVPRRYCRFSLKLIFAPLLQLVPSSHTVRLAILPSKVWNVFAINDCRLPQGFGCVPPSCGCTAMVQPDFSLQRSLALSWSRVPG